MRVIFGWVICTAGKGAESGSGDWVFLLVLALAVVAGILLIRWSKKRGERVAARMARREEVRPVTEKEEEPEEEPVRPIRSLEPVPPAEVPKPVEPKAKVLEPFLVKVDEDIKGGLEKTRSQGFVSRLAGIFKKELDEDFEARLEEVLLTSDIGVKTAQKLLAKVRETLSKSELREFEKVWRLLREEVEAILASVGEREVVERKGALVISVVGVNGTGKTTTIGKLAHRYIKSGKKVMVVAADTFRAAAGEQLGVWAERVGALFFMGPDGRDPSSVAFDGIKKGVEDGADVILVDTAGRLHTNKNLVEELKKMTRVCGKALDGAPHETLLVLDATIGQNAIAQAQTFMDGVGVTGIVLTKLDGTAKGGVVIGISDMLGLPVQYVGIGEKMDDLRPFDGKQFVEALFGN